MTTTATRRPGRPARLTREAVLHAAVELADEAGLDAVTMRTVAGRLDAEAMSLYRHVANKDDLLDGMIDLVYAEISLPEADAGWQEAMRRRAISARDVLSRHPWAIGVMESRTHPGPDNLRHHDVTVGVLLDAGFDSATAVRIYNILDSYIYGFVLQEKTLPVSTPEEMAVAGTELIGAIPADEFPHLARVGRDLLAAGFDYGAEFEAGLDLIIGALGTTYGGAAS